jgi:hypothetical protein
MLRCFVSMNVMAVTNETKLTRLGKLPPAAGREPVE